MLNSGFTVLVLIVNQLSDSGCLDVTSTHKPTTRHSDPHHMSTQHFVHCDNFLLWHFGYVTFFYCDIPTLWQFSTVTLWPCDIFLLWHSDSVTIFYCDIPSQSERIVRPPQKVDGLSHCDIPTHCNFGQPMAGTFCPLWIFIFPVNTLSKLQLILTNDDLVTLSL
jgi:hypothetical protein